MPNPWSLDLVHTDDDDAPDWDPSIDPFGLFSSTLTSLYLYDIPLYPSFLRLRTLTKLRLHYYKIRPTIDTLLTFVEDNQSLQSVVLTIDFKNTLASISQRRAPITNRVRCLSVSCWDATTARTLISNIPSGEVEIWISPSAKMTWSWATFSPESLRRTSHLPSPTLMRYSPSPRWIRLIGPNGNFNGMSMRILQRSPSQNSLYFLSPTFKSSTSCAASHP